MEPIEWTCLTITMCPAPEGGTCLRLVGQLDTAGAKQVEAAMADVRARRPVRIDLSRVEYVDCAGLNLLLRTALEEPRIELACPSPAVSRLITMLGGRGLPSSLEDPPQDHSST